MPALVPHARPLRVAAFVATVLVCAPGSVLAQGCSWVSPTRSAESLSIPGQGQLWFLGAPSIRCTDGVRIRADTAVVYTAQNLTHLMGNVRFWDGAKELNADEARYFTRQGRLQANGNTILRDTIQGSEIQNGNMVLLRQNETRETDQITATTGFDQMRPRAVLYIKPKPDTTTVDSLAVPPEGAGPDRMLPPDSAGPADSVEVQDSIAAPDSALAPDSTQLPDSVVGSDSVRLPDSVVVSDSVPGTDSTVAQDSTVVSDTAAAGPPPLPERMTPEPPPDPADTVQTPFIVEGDRIFLEGEQYFLASGDVVIDRDSLRAYADTAEYDQLAERMLLKGSARVEGDSYDLTGLNINLAMAGGEMSSVRAVREALLVGQDLRLKAPLIQLFLVDGGMERLVAIPLPGDPDRPPETAADSAMLARPVATAEGFRLIADSVEVLAPGEVLQRIFAAGRARGESSAGDSLNVESLPEIARTDWLEGDTVVAYFTKVERDPFLPPDTLADEYTLDELRAVGTAKSLYRIPPADSTSLPGIDPPAVHYVTGTSILIVMGEGEVERMEVEGPTRGWHLEPDGRRMGRDSLVAPDSAAPPPDTASAAGQGTSGAPRRDGGSDGRGREGDGAAVPAAAPGQRVRGRRSRA